MNGVVHQAKVAVVVPTLTGPPTLERLVHSLEEQTLKPSRVVLVYQGSDPERAHSLRNLSDELRLEVLQRQPGLAAARNAGISYLSGDYDVIALPDDDIRYPPLVLETVVNVLKTSGWDALSGRLLSEDSDAVRVAFPSQARSLDRRNVWTSSMEGAYFWSRNFVTAIGELNEELGLGAESPWQSGEGTDALLRGMSAGLRVGYDPAVTAYEAGTAATSPQERIRKARSYARGTGRVYNLHYGRAAQLRTVSGPLLRAVKSALVGESQERAYHAAVAKGRLEGLLGRTFKGRP